MERVSGVVDLHVRIGELEMHIPETRISVDRRSIFENRCVVLLLRDIPISALDRPARRDAHGIPPECARKGCGRDDNERRHETTRPPRGRTTARATTTHGHTGRLRSGGGKRVATFTSALAVQPASERLR